MLGSSVDLYRRLDNAQAGARKFYKRHHTFYGRKLCQMSDAEVEENEEVVEEQEGEDVFDIPDDLRESLLTQVVGYDDICRTWMREKSIRLRVHSGLLESICAVLRIADGPESSFARTQVADEVVVACHDIIIAIRDEIGDLTCQPWPKRPLLVEDTMP